MDVGVDGELKERRDGLHHLSAADRVHELLLYPLAIKCTTRDYLRLVLLNANKTVAYLHGATCYWSVYSLIAFFFITVHLVLSFLLFQIMLSLILEDIALLYVRDLSVHMPPSQCSVHMPPSQCFPSKFRLVSASCTHAA